MVRSNLLKNSRNASVSVLMIACISNFPCALRTMITVVDLWTSMPTYFNKSFIGRLLRLGNLAFVQFKITLSGASFSYYVYSNIVEESYEPQRSDICSYH